MSKEQKKRGFGKFLAGAAIGGALGVLFAPKKGSETRAELKEKIDELMLKVKNIDVEEIRGNINEKIEEIKEELSDLDREKVLKIAKEKGNQILAKTEEVVNIAVEKGTPILEKAAKEMRTVATRVVEDILKKLKEEK